MELQTHITNLVAAIMSYMGPHLVFRQPMTRGDVHNAITRLAWTLQKRDGAVTLDSLKVAAMGGSRRKWEPVIAIKRIARLNQRAMRASARTGQAPRVVPPTSRKFRAASAFVTRQGLACDQDALAVILAVSEGQLSDALPRYLHQDSYSLAALVRDFCPYSAQRRGASLCIDEAHGYTYSTALDYALRAFFVVTHVDQPSARRAVIELRGRDDFRRNGPVYRFAVRNGRGHIPQNALRAFEQQLRAA